MNANYAFPILLLGLTMTGVHAHPTVSRYTCDTPIVIAKTLDAKKTLRICLSGDHVAYTFGDIDRLVNVSDTRFEAFKYNETIEVRIDEKAYRYSYYPRYDFDATPEKIIGVDKNSLRVFENETLIEEIPLTTPQVRQIDASLIRFGIRNIIQ